MKKLEFLELESNEFNDTIDYNIFANVSNNFFPSRLTIKLDVNIRCDDNIYCPTHYGYYSIHRTVVSCQTPFTAGLPLCACTCQCQNNNGSIIISPLCPGQPSFAPTRKPTVTPSLHPSKPPTTTPTKNPTIEPTSEPTDNTLNPTTQPTFFPTIPPTKNPSPNPTFPTPGPTRPTTNPTSDPTLRPTLETRSPTPLPTEDSAATNQNDSPLAGVIIGVSSGIVFVLILCFVIIYFVCKRFKDKARSMFYKLFILGLQYIK